MSQPVTLPKGFIEVEGPKCMMCKQHHSVVVKESDLNRWKKERGVIQRYFPYLSADGREILLTGLNQECYEKAFGKEDDDS